MQYKILLKAGIEQRQQFQGKTLVVLSTGAAQTIDMVVELQGYAVEELRAIKAGLRLRSTGPGFTGAKFKAPVDCEIEVIVSAADISVNYIEGAKIEVTAGAPLPVVNDRGANAGVPLYVSGLIYSDTPAASVVDRASVACGDIAVSLLSADPTRKRARFANLGPDTVTLGTTGHTWAKRVIVLEAGDVWLESDAANLAWVGVTDAGGNASVTVQEVKA